MRALLFPVAALALPVAALAGDCDVPLAAAMKINDIPYRMHMERGSGADAEVSDMVATADRMYVRVDGAWHAMDRDRDTAEEMAAALAAGQLECSLLRQEPVGGVAATVYDVRQTDEDGVTEQTVWIDDASGLMLRIVMKDEDGDGGEVTTGDFGYDDVAAPVGAE